MYVCVFVCSFGYECYVSMIIVVPAISAGLGGVWRSDAGSCEFVCLLCLCVLCVFVVKIVVSALCRCGWSLKE